jgi:uncharacterized membrane protein YkvA (DUF1232 family)
MPLLAKLITVGVVAYALSPIDLIPDFVPVLGLLDDLVLIPFGIWLAIRLIPAELWQQALLQAHSEGPDQWSAKLATAKVAAVLIVVLWITLALVVGYQIMSS